MSSELGTVGSLIVLLFRFTTGSRIGIKMAAGYGIFRQFYNAKRGKSQTVEKFIAEFELVLFSMNEFEMKLPDAVAAFMLLEACNLSGNDSKLVLSDMKDVSLGKMKESIIKISGGQSGGGIQPAAVKEEALFKCNKALYSNSQNSNYGDSRPRRGAGRGYVNRSGKFSNRSDKKVNPLDRNGKTSKCFICGSIYHWARSCPESQYTFKEHERSKNEEENNDSHVMLFVGYNEARKNGKPNALMEQCQGCALLDSGCTKTVAGEKWFKNYQDNLSEYDKAKIKEYQSNSVFTFGDGGMVDSMRKVVIPCYIDNKRSTIETDIVKCDIPLLMSHKSMKKGKMIIDFGNDILTVGNSKVDLEKTGSGHYLLPLSP